MSRPPRLWDGVLRRLSVELSNCAVEAWLHPLSVESDGERLRLLCPNALHRDRVERLRLDIARCVAAEGAGGLQLEIAIESECACESEPAAQLIAQGRGAAPEPAPSAHPSEAGTSTPGDAPAPRPPGGAARAALAPSTTQTNAATAAGERASTRRPARPRNAPARRGTAAAGASSSAASQPHLPHYTFDDFVVGPCNALAREASLAVAHRRQRRLSLLFLASDSGLGKTHLARAIVTAAACAGGPRPLYVSAETFTSDFTHSARSNEMPSFKRRYRESSDLVVIEDVQQLGTRKKTQLELFHTLAHLLDVGARVVLTSDRLPREIEGLEPRVRSQMTSGMVAEIEAPDASVRRAILRHKAARGGVHLPQDCLDLLVHAARGSVRDLEGVLIQLVASASLLQRPIDLALTERALRKLVPQLPKRRLDCRSVVEAVATFCGSTPEKLSARSKRGDVLWPRQIAMYLCKRYTDAPLTEIARAFGRKHSAVSNAVKVVERRLLEHAPQRYKVEALIERLDELQRGG